MWILLLPRVYFVLFLKRPLLVIFFQQIIWKLHVLFYNYFKTKITLEYIKGFKYIIIYLFYLKRELFWKFEEARIFNFCGCVLS